MARDTPLHFEIKQVSPALFFDMVPKDACTWERQGLQVGGDPQGCACLFASAQVLDDWLDEARPITHVHCISSWLALCVCYHFRFIVPSAFSSWQINPCTGSLNLTVYLLFPGAFHFRRNVCPPPGISDPVKNQSLGSLWLILFFFSSCSEAHSLCAVYSKHRQLTV